MWRLLRPAVIVENVDGRCFPFDEKALLGDGGCLLTSNHNTPQCRSARRELTISIRRGYRAGYRAHRLKEAFMQACRQVANALVEAMPIPAS